MLGALNIGWRTDFAPRRRHIDLAEALAGQAATILDNARAHDELSHRTEQIQAIIDQTPAGVVVFDAQGRRILANQSVRETRGIPADPNVPVTQPDPVIRRTDPATGRLLGPDETPAARALRGETVAGFEYAFWRPGQAEPGLVRASARPLRAADGSISGAVGVYEDVTQQRLLERQLRHSEERFRALTENASDLCVVIDAAGTVRYASPSNQHVLGREPGQTVGRGFPDWVHADDLTGVHKAYATMRRSAGSTVRFTFRCQHANGGWLWLDAVATNLLDNPAVAGLVINARDVTDRQQAEDALRQQALHDALTGLPNRTLLQDRLEQALLAGGREGRAVAVLMLDLDRFKEVNDTFGHHSGDLLLRQVAARLQRALRKSDTVARMGGDEFSVLLTAFRDATEVVRTVDKIRVALERPFPVDGRVLHIAASIGLALYPEHAQDAETLLRLADVAMYGAKRAGGGYQLYDEHDEHTSNHATLAAELRQAIEQGELALDYQPKVRFATGTDARVEALVRWHHPRLGLLAPDRFVPLAEQTGLIRPLTRWVLDDALRQCCAWHAAGLRISVAVNLSVHNLQDPHFVALVRSLIRRSQVEPSWLRVEITESVLMADPVQASHTISGLQALGLRLSIDDFGTGYSSLSYLTRLPVDEVKIDKSFVAGMASNQNDAIIVRSTIDLAHNLGLKAVAEGVESQHVWDMLAGLGCDSAQGYYMGRPMPPPELEEWVRESPWGLRRTAPAGAGRRDGSARQAGQGKGGLRPRSQILA